MVLTIDRKEFGEIPDLEIGMPVELQSDTGTFIMTVTAMTDKTVTMDGNHPLAGETLYFDVKIGDIRDATAEEMEKGHIHNHNCGGCGCGHEH